MLTILGGGSVGPALLSSESLQEQLGHVAYV